MAAMTTMGLSQRISDPTSQGSHMLDLVFCLDREEGDLNVVVVFPFAFQQPLCHVQIIR